MSLELRFGPHLIGVIEGAFCADNTGCGVFVPSSDPSSVPRRILNFIELSKDWHARLRGDRPHDLGEFDEFRDLYESDQWHTVAPDGSASMIAEPVFVESEITWRATGQPR